MKSFDWQLAFFVSNLTAILLFILSLFMHRKLVEAKQRGDRDGIVHTVIWRGIFASLAAITFLAAMAFFLMDMHVRG